MEVVRLKLDKVCNMQSMVQIMVAIQIDNSIHIIFKFGSSVFIMDCRRFYKFYK